MELGSFWKLKDIEMSFKWNFIITVSLSGESRKAIEKLKLLGVRIGGKGSHPKWKENVKRVCPRGC